MRWRGGLVLFLLLMTIISYFTINSLGEAAWYNSLNENIAIIFLWALPIAIIEIAIFLISLHFTEKKIINKKFSYKWLFLFNLVFLVIVFIALEVIGTLYLSLWMAITNASSEAGMVVLLWWFIAIPSALSALGSVILFSLIPSIIFYKIYNNKKAQKIIFYIAIAFIVLILITAIVMRYTCDLGESMTCIARKAKQDLSICEGQKTTRDKKRCYTYLAEHVGYSKDIEPCLRYIDLGYSHEFNRCVMFIAKSSGGTSFCEYINQNLSNNTKEDCIDFVNRYKKE